MMISLDHSNDTLRDTRPHHDSTLTVTVTLSSLQIKETTTAPGRPHRILQPPVKIFLLLASIPHQQHAVIDIRGTIIVEKAAPVKYHRWTEIYSHRDRLLHDCR